MSKHTPGPWTAIANPGEARINAYLIAAAPEMLNLLEVLLNSNLDAWDKENIRAVLAKAKGEKA